MKKFLLIALMALGIVSNSFAATATLAVAGASTNQIIAGQLLISSVQVNNDSASALVVKFFDAQNTNLTFIVGTYPSFASYATNLVTTFTNINGVVTANTNAAWYTYATTVPQTTNNFRIITQVNVAASSSVTWTPEAGVYTSFGLLSTNNGAANYVVTYATIR